MSLLRSDCKSRTDRLRVSRAQGPDRVYVDGTVTQTGPRPETLEGLLGERRPGSGGVLRAEGTRWTSRRTNNSPTVRDTPRLPAWACPHDTGPEADDPTRSPGR